MSKMGLLKYHKMVPSRGDHIDKMFFGAETITNTSTRSFEKILDGHSQEIEEHMCQNGSKYTQMAPIKDGDTMKKWFLEYSDTKKICVKFHKKMLTDCQEIEKHKKTQTSKNIQNALCL